MMAVDHIVPHARRQRAGNYARLARRLLEHRPLLLSLPRIRQSFAAGKRPDFPRIDEEFISLRDRLFVDRKRFVLLSHEHELAFFDERPWRS